MATIDITNTIRGRVPRIPYAEMARDVLPGYHLSLVICGDKLAQRMNAEYRNKTYYPNVLSFPLSEDEGEIFLNVRKAEREARQYGVAAQRRIALLYVHGLFHLKGLDHGDKMEEEEQRILKKYRLH
jgi:probable rRNA maturation factor